MIKTCNIAFVQRSKNVTDMLMLSEASKSLLFKARYTALKDKLWSPGETITFLFLDGDKYVQDKCQEIMYEWATYANILFEKVEHISDSKIRISFNYDGSWSYVGTDALNVQVSQPTMNFGWLNKDTPDIEYQRVVLHEVGHMLGLAHEHQNPSVSIPWNKELVYQTYSGPPNFWNKSDIDNNIFGVYEHNLTNYSEFDPESIMLYPVPNDLTVGNYEIGWNSKLSEKDKEWARLTYPPHSCV